MAPADEFRLAPKASKPTAYATSAIVGVNVAVFLAMVVTGVSPPRRGSARQPTEVVFLSTWIARAEAGGRAALRRG